MSDHMTAQWEQARALHLAGSLSEAAEACLRIWQTTPQHHPSLHLLGKILLEGGDPERATGVLNSALGLAPGCGEYHLDLGHALQLQGKLEGAMEEYQRALKLDPALHLALTRLASCLMERKQWSLAQRLLEQSLRLRGSEPLSHIYLAKVFASTGSLARAEFHSRLYHHHAGKPFPAGEESDAFFVDPQLALATALRGNIFYPQPAIASPQLCYYSGPEFAAAPSTLIRVPTQGFGEFFVETRLRRPRRVQFDPALPAQVERAAALATALDLSGAVRAARAAEYGKRCQELQPDFSESPWRVLVPASRNTTVMQYASRNLATAFERLGCATELCIERDSMEELDNYLYLRAQFEFNPHLLVNINHRNNDHLHPMVRNVIWWQDPMPELVAGAPLPWRERDQVFSFNRELDGYLQRCRAPRIRRQGLCVDDTVFRVAPEVKRRARAVFVGYSYRPHLEGTPAERWVLAELERRFAAGVALDRGVVEELARQSGISGERVFLSLVHFTVRDVAVRWLCRASDLIDVEVYGGFWEDDPIVSPFFKGEVGRGLEIARLYQESTHVLVPHPFDLQSQRLVEAAACGAVPVVYDCRYRAEPPHWDDECAWFSTEEQLRAALLSTPRGDPTRIAADKSWERFASTLLELARAG